MRLPGGGAVLTAPEIVRYLEELQAVLQKLPEVVMSGTRLGWPDDLCETLKKTVALLRAAVVPFEPQMGQKTNEMVAYVCREFPSYVWSPWTKDAMLRPLAFAVREAMKWRNQDREEEC